MPVPTPFSLAGYCADTSYPARLSVGLFSGYKSEPGVDGLGLLIECAFPGYQRFSDDLWEIRTHSSQGGSRLRSKFLQWICNANSPGSAALGYFVLAVMDSGEKYTFAVEFDSPFSLAIPMQFVQCQIDLMSLESRTLGGA